MRFNNQIFKGKPGVGHFAVIVGLDSKGKKVIIGDPDPPFFKKISVKKIVKAISANFDGIKRGIYLVSNK